MKVLGIVAVAFVGLTLTVTARLGGGGPQTGDPSNNGGGTTGGTQPEPPTPEWKARILAVYADGSMSRSERKEMIRFMSSLPRPDRLNCLVSWARLQRQVAGSTDPAVVAGVVATWAASDPGAAAAWLNNLPRR